MAEGRALWQVKPYIVFFPAIFLSITVLAVNLLGDGLRDALDPRLAKRLSDGALLEVENLQTHFGTLDGVVRAVEACRSHRCRRDAVAIVGESGCGKSVTSMSILRLIPEPAGQDRRRDPLRGPRPAGRCRSGDARSAATTSR
jgi:hypothetical protein